MEDTSRNFNDVVICSLSPLNASLLSEANDFYNEGEHPHHVFEARHESTEESGFFITHIVRYGESDNAKVQIKPDKRGVFDLMNAFRDISPEVLQEVWESRGRSWNACFDVLNAWVSSHGPVIMSTKQFEFLSDISMWPPLCQGGISVSVLSSRLKNICLSTSLSNSDVNSEGEGDWSLCEASDDNSDIEENWVDVGVREGAGVTVQQRVNLCVPVMRSFKDVLLTPSPQEQRAYASASSSSPHQPRNVWRPAIVCVDLPAQHRHRDRVYMDSVLSQYALRWDDVDDEDDCGNATKCFALSARTNCSRVRSAVKQGNNQNVKTLRCKY